MIVELRLLIFEVKSWRSGAAYFKNQNSTIITRQSILLAPTGSNCNSSGSARHERKPWVIHAFIIRAL
jgi:hypothetical protein